MDAFRQKGLSSAIYGALIIVTVVIFVVQFRPDAGRASGTLSHECAAEIRGRCLEPKDYYAELSLIAPGRVDAAQMRALGLRKIALDGIVERELLNDDADRLGIEVSENEINDELEKGRAHFSLPTESARQFGYNGDMARILPVLNQDNKKFDYKVYDRVVRQYTNRSPTEFKEMQRRELRAARMRDLVRSRARISDDEAFDTFAERKSSAVIRYVRLRRDWFIAHALDLSPEAIDKWTAEHADEVNKSFEAKKSQFLPECWSARHILIKVPETATDQDKSEARERIEAALARIKKGEKFEKVAREVSEDGSAAQGGDLGCFQKGRMVKPFEEAVLALKPGEVSPIVTTEFGFHVIKLEGDYKDAEAEAAGRRETAKALMIGQEGDRLAAETGKQIMAEVKGGKKLDDALNDALATIEAAEARRSAGSKKAAPAAADSKDDEGAVGAARPKVEISSQFSKAGDPISGVLPGQSVGDMAFALAKEGDVPNDLVRLNDGYAVMQLKERDLATREQFDKDRETFLPDMLREKQFDALASYVTRLRDSAKSELKVNEAYARPPEKAPGEGEEE